MIRHHLRCRLTLLMGLAFTGCFREVVRDPHAADQSNDDAIVVTTKDGFRYFFGGGDYVARVDSAGVEVLRGKGKRYRANSSEYVRFEGNIPFALIEKMTESETTPFLYLSIITLGAAIGFAVWWTIAVRGG